LVTDWLPAPPLPVVAAGAALVDVELELAALTAATAASAPGHDDHGRDHCCHPEQPPWCGHVFLLLLCTCQLRA
jgi:hypothetical protein